MEKVSKSQGFQVPNNSQLNSIMLLNSYLASLRKNTSLPSTVASTKERKICGGSRGPIVVRSPQEYNL